MFKYPVQLLESICISLLELLVRLKLFELLLVFLVSVLELKTLQHTVMLCAKINIYLMKLQVLI